ncbi:hypothetical protein [Nocardioides sp. TF02-7]|uniref:hypothetical protein n=1 Tax=Nocardioides sp. TF02-7 TaxID=2917724 RepID=UPI001F05C7EB|nr:hypothetical protein [Nocardioides sp. TF02-7]UMG91015.1 hypothetical protein MF408_12320 [Nocardioides sp. TF02-7]
MNRHVGDSIKEEYKGNLTVGPDGVPMNADPNFMPADLKRLSKKLEDVLGQEKAIRERLKDDKPAADQEVEELWAHPMWMDVRPFRPLRYDDFDQALSEARQEALEDRAREHSDVAAWLTANEATLGVTTKPKDAAKKVQEQRELERRRARAAGLGRQEAQGPAVQEAQPPQWLAARKAPPARPTDQQPEVVHKALKDEHGPSERLADAKSGFKDAGKAFKMIGKAEKGAQKAVVGTAGISEGDGTVGGELAERTATGLGGVLGFVSNVLSLIEQLKDIKKGVADPGAKVEAARTTLGALSSGSSVTRTGLKATRKGIEQFGNAGNAHFATMAQDGLPVVGIVTAVLGAIDNALEMVQVTDRLTAGRLSRDNALLERKGPLVAAISRINSRNAQLMEKACFALAKNVTMATANIGTIVTAGGLGFFEAAKVGTKVVDLAHTLGHKVYDLADESRAATAKKAFGVLHEEGASRDVLKHDIGSSIDVLLVAAKKHKMKYARTMLLDYGVHEEEIDGMRYHELRERVLDRLDAEGDPKTVKEKVEEKAASISEALGKKPDKNPVPEWKKVPKSTGQKVREKIGKIGKVGEKVAEAPGKVWGKVTDTVDDLRAQHTDAVNLVNKKNELGYKGRVGPREGVGAEALPARPGQVREVVRQGPSRDGGARARRRAVPGVGHVADQDRCQPAVRRVGRGDRGDRRRHRCRSRWSEVSASGWVPDECGRQGTQEGA